jgi:hypothetical protein
MMRVVPEWDVTVMFGVDKGPIFRVVAPYIEDVLQTVARLRFYNHVGQTTPIATATEIRIKRYQPLAGSNQGSGTVTVGGGGTSSFDGFGNQIYTSMDK